MSDLDRTIVKFHKVPERDRVFQNSTSCSSIAATNAKLLCVETNVFYEITEYLEWKSTRSYNRARHRCSREKNVTDCALNSRFLRQLAIIFRICLFCAQLLVIRLCAKLMLTRHTKGGPTTDWVLVREPMLNRETPKSVFSVAVAQIV